MRAFLRVGCFVLLPASLLASVAVPVAAQSAVDYILGPSPAPVGTGYIPSIFSPYRPSTRSYGSGQGDAAWRDSRTYRSVCVRMCDGYYFPISYAASRDRLSQDAGQCEATCGSEARLFYYPNPGGEIADATDLTGRGYAQLPVAFLYRKRTISGCACRPAPWSEAELARHRTYAEEQAILPKPGPEGDQSEIGSPVAMMAEPPRRAGRAALPPLRLSPGMQRGTSWLGGTPNRYVWPGDQAPRYR